MQFNPLFLLPFAGLCYIHTSRGRRTLNNPVSCDMVNSFGLTSYDDDGGGGGAIQNDSASSSAFDLNKRTRASDLASFFFLIFFLNGKNSMQRLSCVA